VLNQRIVMKRAAVSVLHPCTVEEEVFEQKENATASVTVMLSILDLRTMPSTARDILSQLGFGERLDLFVRESEFFGPALEDVVVENFWRIVRELNFEVPTRSGLVH
jgi:hypothetical protein